jgi:hypothetical protein
LISPTVSTPISWMAHASARPSQAMVAALALAKDAVWQQQVATHTGLFTPY